jgi:hypothetical protein
MSGKSSFMEKAAEKPFLDEHLVTREANEKMFWSRWPIHQTRSRACLTRKTASA